ncbi:putative transcription factor C2H2 family [Helianthus debilis subsp. tardiflorus]
MQPMDSDHQPQPQPQPQHTFTNHPTHHFFYDNNNFTIADDDSSDDPDDISDDYNVLINRINPSTQKTYTVLTENDLINIQQQDVTKVATVLSIPKESACMLLISYNWSVNNVYEAWFQDEDKTRKRIGWLYDPVDDPGVEFHKPDERIVVDCGICFELFRVSETASCGCDHRFCKVCWKGYVGMAVQDGMGCLSLRCPKPGCEAAVSPGMVNELVDEKERKRYEGYVLRTYVESSKRMKWCPGPGCECAVLFEDDFETGGYDVVCVCKHGFCWKCLEDAHRPLVCETVEKWVLKNTSEAENTNWIFAYTKPCPKCKRAIEKNNGCMHMTCGPPCGYQFCWLCLGPYFGHDGVACNGFSKKSEVEKQKVATKKAIERYTHYYERWAANERSRKQALLSLDKIESVYLKKLCSTYCQPEMQLRFIIDAWLQIVECRRVLKWTYAYGYYIPKIEHAKRLFFEYVQGEAEVGLERLHGCAEKELRTYIVNGEATEEEFNSFRVKLTDLTSVTRSYFANLVRALENGLSEVDSHEACTKTRTSSKQGVAVGSSSKARGRRRSGQGGESSNRASDHAKRLRMMMMMRLGMDEAQRNENPAAGESSSRDKLGD